MRPNGWNDFYSRAGAWISETARTKPEALLLLGAGCALLMRTATNAAWPTLGNGREGERNGGDVRDRAAGTAAAYAGAVADYTSAAASSAVSTSDRLTRRAGSTLQDTIDRIVREQPLVLALVGIAAGAVTAALFPRTRFEEQTLGGLGEALAESAAQTGESLKEAAVAAGERLKDSAQEHGLSPDGFKDIAREAAQTFGATAGVGTEGTAQQRGSSTRQEESAG